MVESLVIDMLRERFGGRHRWMGERVGGGDDDKTKKKHVSLLRKEETRVFICER